MGGKYAVRVARKFFVFSARFGANLGGGFSSHPAAEARAIIKSVTQRFMIYTVGNCPTGDEKHEA